MITLASWNVNGLRACLKHGFLDAAKDLDADILCLQEIKMEKGQAAVDLCCHEFWNSAERKGYSGTAVFSKTKPNGEQYGLGIDKHDGEGRVITLFYEKFTLVNVYTPNAQHELKRLDYRMEWEDAFRAYLTELDKSNPLVICGDLNVAHQEIDLKNAKSNRMNPGFTDEERGKMTELLGSGFTDIFRKLNPDKSDAYTWWSYRANARENNVGWRIDYFLISERLLPGVAGARIHPHIFGSDHCPVDLTLDL